MSCQQLHDAPDSALDEPPQTVPWNPFRSALSLLYSAFFIAISNNEQAYDPAVNIEQVGNAFKGVNYGNVTQTVEESNVLRNFPLHPDISGRLSDYFPNSRTDDEAHILGWTDSNHSLELVLCVLGKVGVGKTTLAKHLAARLRQDHRLAAEVFLGFALPDWSPELVIRMIAGQLCATYPVLKRVVAEAMDLDVGPSVSLDTRIRKLILEPIRSLGLLQSLVVMLDALDQWEPHPILIKALGCLTTEAHLIKFVVLGRPGLNDHFQNVSMRRYDLPDISKRILRAYFSERFTQVRWEFGRMPSSQTIDQLVDKAEGLFIWSSTLCSLLEDDLSCPKPHDTLCAILQSQQSIGHDEIMANLYHDTINLRFPKPNHKVKVKVYLGAVLVLQEPLPVAAFASLVSMDAPSIRKIQAELAVLQAGRPQGIQDLVLPAASTFHLSFLEYLQSPETPSHLAFPIDTFASHASLGKACLEELHRISSFSQFSFISPLQKYVMRYWPAHTAHGTPSVSPTSDVEWKATSHSSILEQLSVAQWQHWATKYLQLVHSNEAQDLVVEDLEPILPPTLDPIRNPPSGTRRHLISRVTQWLLKGPATAGTPDAIVVAEVAVRLQHQSSDAWLALGTAYYDAAQSNASSTLIESAVQACRCAAGIGGDGGHRVQWMLTRCLYDRFARLGFGSDLDEAICLGRAVLFLPQAGHSDENRTSYSNFLANYLWAHFELTGTAESLAEAIVLYREALSLLQPNHPCRGLLLNNLANALCSQFKSTGAIETLDESTVLIREALLLRPAGHPGRPLCLNNLANSLQSRFEVAGSTASLEEAIVLNREALSLRPPGHPLRSSSLNNLANCLRSHLEVTGSTLSLDEAIVLSREALSLLQPNHPSRGLLLNNLSNSLSSHFVVTGSTASLDEAIVLSREALSLWLPGHPDRPLGLNNLASALQSCFKVSGSTASLEEALVLNREALSLQPPGHPLRPLSLNNLSNSLGSHFRVTGSSASLKEAILLGREALSLLPTGHINHAHILNNLANSLQMSYNLTGNIHHLNEAISLVPATYEAR